MIGMEAIFFALIQQLNASVFTLIAMLLITFWLVYKAGGIIQSYKDYNDSKQKVETKIDSIKESISEVKATTNLLYQAHLNTVKSASPIKLTPLGEEISGTLSIPQKVNDHWNDISTEMKKRDSQNPYDIQSVAMAIARNCFDKIFTDAEQGEVKTYAFKKGLNLLEIYPIIAVEIRDRVFRENGIPLDDVDKHDPAKRNSGGTAPE